MERIGRAAPARTSSATMTVAIGTPSNASSMGRTGRVVPTRTSSATTMTTFGSPSTAGHSPSCSTTRKIRVTSNFLFLYAAIAGLFVLRQLLSSHNLASTYDRVNNVFLPPPHSFTNATTIGRPNSLLDNPLGVPLGKAKRRRSRQVVDAQLNKERSRYYGGLNDAPHLGGFTMYDRHGVSPALWRNMITQYGIHSVLDVGCGVGISTRWFLEHGVDSVCVEGSSDAVAYSVLANPSQEVIQHDYTLGPWWPDKTYDAIWCAEFLQHVSIQFQRNYIQTFRKAALLFVTTAQLAGGWHHTEVHSDNWWIFKLESYGFKYSATLTEQSRAWAKQEQQSQVAGLLAPDGNQYNAAHIWRSIKVFINPVVAALPQHMHLFPELGCYGGNSGKSNSSSSAISGNDGIQHRSCGPSQGEAWETPRDPSFSPLPIKPEMQQRWVGVIQKVLKSNPAGAAAAAAAGNAVATEYATADKRQIAVTRKDDTTHNQQTNRDIAGAIKQRNISDHPVILFRAGKLPIDQLPKLPVVVWPYVELGVLTAESMHIEQNGIMESKYLEFARNNLSEYDPNVVWIGDVGFPTVGYTQSCTRFAAKVKEAQDNRKKLGLTHVWPIFVVDFTDGSAYPRCLPLEKAVGRDLVWYHRRSIVKFRRWVNETEWIDTGIMGNETFDGVFYKHMPLIARTDTVIAIQDVLASKYRMKLGDAIERLPRNQTDVSYFWPRDGITNVGGVDANLRNKVGDIIHDMGATDGIKVFVGLAGDAVQTGRRGVKSAYVEAMLDSKIVVVVQRDTWEDHYRLFEALLSGAMVMTDRMLSLPPGLENGTSIVEFTSADDLRAKILYYQKNDQERQSIAKQGRFVTMSQHRTWHRIEEVVFGKPVSTCSVTKQGSPCPYVAHFNEALQ